jgi:ABC-2 type transport system permease protein
MVGLGTLLIGAAPRAFPVAWALLGWSLFLSWVGQLLGLPDWVTKLTPFAALPGMPVEPMSWTAWLVESLIAAVLVALGLAAYRRRDVA